MTRSLGLVSYIVPSAYAIFDDLTAWVWGWFGRRPDLRRADLHVLDEIDQPAMGTA